MTVLLLHLAFMLLQVNWHVTSGIYDEMNIIHTYIIVYEFVPH
jgi:hypothetical protein